MQGRLAVSRALQEDRGTWRAGGARGGAPGRAGGPRRALGPRRCAHRGPGRTQRPRAAGRAQPGRPGRAIPGRPGRAVPGRPWAAGRPGRARGPGRRLQAQRAGAGQAREAALLRAGWHRDGRVAWRAGCAARRGAGLGARCAGPRQPTEEAGRARTAGPLDEAERRRAGGAATGVAQLAITRARRARLHSAAAPRSAARLVRRVRQTKSADTHPDACHKRQADGQRLPVLHQRTACVHRLEVGLAGGARRSTQATAQCGTCSWASLQSRPACWQGAGPMSSASCGRDSRVSVA